MRITTYRTKLNEDKLNVLIKEKSVNYPAHKKLSSPDIVAEMMNDIFDMKNLAEEHIYMIANDTKQKVLGIFELSHGTVNSTLITPREIFIRALLCGCINFILCHNHPSGDTTPSNEDINITNRINEVGKLFGIRLLDHIIIGDDYYSFKEDYKL